jgi:hypothetical protein
MTKTEAIAHLKANPDSGIILSNRDATGEFFEHTPCWIDSTDGILTRSHPTDRGTCGCPDDGSYSIGKFVDESN